MILRSVSNSSSHTLPPHTPHQVETALKDVRAKLQELQGKVDGMATGAGVGAGFGAALAVVASHSAGGGPPPPPTPADNLRSKEASSAMRSLSAVSGASNAASAAAAGEAQGLVSAEVSLARE